LYLAIEGVAKNSVKSGKNRAKTGQAVPKGKLRQGDLVGQFGPVGQVSISWLSKPSFVQIPFYFFLAVALYSPDNQAGRPLGQLPESRGFHMNRMLLWLPATLLLAPIVPFLGAQQQFAKPQAESEAAASKISWKKTVIDKTFRSEGVAVADINKDGKLDIFVGDVWYEAPIGRCMRFAPSRSTTLKRDTVNRSRSSPEISIMTATRI
jgi:hypothetical protein